jgi:hypothetical protein
MNNPPGFPDPLPPQPSFGGQPLPPQAPLPPGIPGAPGVPPSFPSGPVGPNPAPGQPSWMPQTPTPSPESGGSKTAYVLLGVAVVIILGLVAFFVTQLGDDEEAAGDPTAASLTIPEVTIPEITIPQITIPQITIPQITIPGVTTAPSAVVPTQPAAPTTTAPLDLLTSDQLPAVIAQIATARGAAPLRILSANLYGEYVIVQVQDPNISANVDQYMWRNGTVGTPDPVTLTGDGDLESNLFSDTEVNWAAIPGLVATALAQIPIEGATVTHINVERNLPFSADVQIRVFVDGTRGSGFLDADAQGNVLEVNQG